MPRPPFTLRLKPWQLVAFDVLLGILVFLSMTKGLVRQVHQARMEWYLPVGFAMLGLMAIAIMMRRVMPLGALAVAGGAAAVLALSGIFGNPDTEMCLLFYMVALLKPVRVALCALVVTLCAWGATIGICAWWVQSSRHYGLSALIADQVIAVAAWTVGWAVRSGRAYQAGLRDLAEERVRRERERADTMVTNERLRVAREVHDVVGHTLGVIAVQAGVGHYIAEARPDEAAASLAAIESASRAALVEMRALLGQLRDAEAGDRLAAGLADLDIVLAQARRSGLAVDLVIDGHGEQLPRDVDLAAYRIVQEALTNVVRHADTDRAKIFVCHRENAVTVEITDEGRGCPSHETGAGHGLVGIRERVSMHGGTLYAGPRSPRGFRVTARLPLQPSRAGVLSGVAGSGAVGSGVGGSGAAAGSGVASGMGGSGVAGEVTL
jgi:signal transduction histidine kinase